MVKISWITPQIGVSRAFADKDISFIKEQGIEAIVDVRSESTDNKNLIESYDMKFLHVNIDDTYTPSVDQLKKIINFVNPLLKEKKKILVHCQSAVGRSPTVVISILVSRGMDVSEAVGLVEDKHPWISLSTYQQRFIYMKLNSIIGGLKD